MNFRIYLFLFAIGCYQSSCMHRQRNASGVEAAMQNYDRYILSMNVDSISSIYTEEGELGNIARGRDSIRKFLARFASFKVLSQISRTDSILIHKDTAIQSGTYSQKVIVPGNNTVSVKGLFIAKWIWQRKEGWLIRHMETTPLK